MLCIGGGVWNVGDRSFCYFIFLFLGVGRGRVLGRLVVRRER